VAEISAGRQQWLTVAFVLQLKVLQKRAFEKPSEGEQMNVLSIPIHDTLSSSSPHHIKQVSTFRSSSVADPVPNPDPYVFRPPESGSGSTSQRYGSGSGSFYHQAKTLRKSLIPTSVADPDRGTGAFLTPGSGIRNRFFPDPGSQTHTFESLVTIFWAKSSIIL
jgi:hypothetical protein